MVEWRDRGYVQDSEEEDDLELSSLDTQNCLEDVAKPFVADESAKRYSLVELEGQGSSCPKDAAAVDKAIRETGDSQRPVTESISATSSTHTIEPVGEEQKTLSVSNYPIVLITTKRTTQNLTSVRWSGGVDELDKLSTPPINDIVQLASTVRIRTNKISYKPGETESDYTSPDLFDVPSSPLSEAPASPAGNTNGSAHLPLVVQTPCPPFTPTPRYLNQQDSLASGSQNPSSTLSTASESQRQAIIEENRSNLRRREEILETTGRTFRRRNPIQLHPYLLENEQYRQTFKSRGLRPVAVTHEERREVDETQTAGNKHKPNKDFFESQFSALDASSDYSPRSSAAQEAAGDEVARVDLDSDDYQLPDTSHVFGSQLTTALREGFKRRKIMSNTADEAARITQSCHSATATLPHNDLFATQPPLHSKSAGPDDARNARTTVIRKPRLKRFKIPRGFVAARLPTPVTSSEAGWPRLGIDNLESESEPETVHGSLTEPLNTKLNTPSGSKTITPNSVTRPPSPSPSESSVSESENIRAAQRRIRGVLPASWLRLDQQSRSSRAAGQRDPGAANSTSKEAPSRGVAHRVSNSTSRATVLSPPRSSSPVKLFEISDDSASTRQAPLRQKLQRLQTRIQPRTASSPQLLVYNTHDIEEDDWIDPMLPSTTRERRKERGPRRQLKLADAFKHSSHDAGREQRHRTADIHQRGGISRSAREKSHRTERARRKIPPKLSIVDSVTLGQSHPRPDFLRIAIRRARSRADAARQSPSRKFISLHNRYDDAEAVNVLRDWRKGHITPRNTPENATIQDTASRTALSELSENRQHIFPSPVKTVFHSYKPPVTSTLELARPALKLRQGRLNNFHLSPSENRDVLKQTLQESSSRCKVRSQAQRPPQIPSSIRPGNLERLQADNDDQHHGEAFRRELISLDSWFDNRRAYQQRTANPLIERFLGVGNENVSASAPQRMPTNPTDSSENAALPQGKITRQLRKRHPRRLNVEDMEIDRIPHSAAFVDLTPEASVPQAQSTSCPTLHGLRPFGTLYTADFGVSHLPVGSYFHHTTLVGGGELNDALQLEFRDLDVPTTAISVQIEGRVTRWGAWNEDVSMQIDEVFTSIRKAVELCLPSTGSAASSLRNHSTVSLFSTARTIIRYFSKTLHFLDAIDRDSFVGKVSGAIAQSLDTIIPAFDINTGTERPSPTKSVKVRLLTYLAVLASQVFQVSSHSFVKQQSKERADAILRYVVQVLVSSLFHGSLLRVWAFLRTIQQQRVQETGIGEDDVEIEAVVVLSHLISRSHLTGLDFWEALNHALGQRDLDTCDSLEHFEKTWHDIFAVLPFLDFDSTGILKRSTGPRSPASWYVVKVMLSRILNLYICSPIERASLVNPYIRAVLSRCYTLLRLWGWVRCESVLNCIFDFFARRGLSLLRDEESKDSPAFLAELHTTSSADLRPGDRSFDIFLKTLYSGLTEMRSVYGDKKIGNIAWRFIPNHGRLHEKEKDLRHDDLDTLRNHHNLLCVLYAAPPPATRPKLDLIHNLVDYESSHSEVCRLNIRSWANLARFQLANDEPLTNIDPLVSWFNNILRQSIHLHRNARAEAEKQFEVSNNAGVRISKELLESTIDKNEKQIEGLLTMALAAMRDVLETAKNRETAKRLFETACVAETLGTFNAKQTRLNALVALALEPYQIYFRCLLQTKINSGQSTTGEDSQEYGEWPDVEEVTDVLGQTPQCTQVDSSIALPVQQLLSTCFGAEDFFDEALLTKLTGTWVHVCQALVRTGQHDWSYYLDPHSPGSWHQLRDTDQKRKLFPYYLTSIIILDPSVYDENLESIVAGWLISLVDREAMFKYQHLLTNALLNARPNEPLVDNLPFVLNNRSQAFEISLSSLRERRLGLISSVLANMRTTLENATIRPADETMHLRQLYKAVLKQMMTAMKKNYEETQHGSTIRGAYVNFVQQVVETLQQYTSDICPVDHFFTDSAAFPLPSSDPTYVVGRLKNYGLRTSDVPTQKKLATFIQTVCERATIDNQTDYFVGQLKKSVDNSYETGNVSDPSLRRLLIQGIFPAYVECVFSSDCGWIVAKPVFEAITQIFDDLIFCFSLSDLTSVVNVTAMLTDFLTSLRQTTKRLLHDPALLAQPTVLNILATAYQTVTRAVGVVDYVHRSSRAADEAVACIVHFVTLGNIILEHTQDQQRASSAPTPDRVMSPVGSPPFIEIRAFCKRDLQEALKGWIKHDDTYYVVRGQSRKEVLIDIGTLGQERENAAAVVEAYLDVVDSMPAFAGLQPSRRRRQPLLAENLLF